MQSMAARSQVRRQGQCFMYWANGAEQRWCRTVQHEFYYLIQTFSVAHGKPKILEYFIAVLTDLELPEL